MNKPKVIITSMPRYAYFQWFLLGFYELERMGIIALNIRHSLYEHMVFLFNSRLICGGLLRILKKWRINNRYVFKDSYNLTGYYIENGEKKRFVIDSADAPFLFSSKELERCSVYFKMQCPLDLDSQGFQLNKDVLIPWTDHEHKDKTLLLQDEGERRPCDSFEKNKRKIRPLMIGVRLLARGCSYRALSKAYDSLLDSRGVKKDKKLMCYFGNSSGPKIPKAVRELDYDSEMCLMGCFHDKMDHPNEKRSIAAKIIKDMGDGYDARVINEGNSDSGKHSNTDQIIPLAKFSYHVARFQYNLNISGYRLSIPNRFIDSFVSGTAIVTDKLSVRWYKPFGKSVFETVEMGYLKNTDVNWQKFRNDLNELPEISSQQVIDDYEEKWTPVQVAKYIIEELKNA